jgi:cobalt-zinc-cadmium efflux system protein
MAPHAHHGHETGTGGPALTVALGLTLGFAAVEAAAGWWAGSLALLGDAGHMVTDSASLALAAAAARLARRTPTARHSYGFGRVEILAAVVNALFMLAVIVGLAVAAVGRLQAPRPVDGGAVAVVALIGLLVNALVAWLLARGERTLNVRAALLHVIGDLLGSVAALVAGAVILATGWTPIDPLLSLAIAGLILFSSLRLLREALHALMEGVPLHLSLEEIGRALAQVPGVRSVHDLHVWTLSSNRVALSAHLVVDDLSRWESVLRAVTTRMHERFGIDHLTLQPEPLIRPVAWTDKRTHRDIPRSRG